MITSTRVGIQSVFEHFNGGFKNSSLYLLHEGRHKSKIYLAFFVYREQYFLSLYAFIVYFSIETILFRQTIDDGNHEKIRILI